MVEQAVAHEPDQIFKLGLGQRNRACQHWIDEGQHGSIGPSRCTEFRQWPSLETGCGRGNLGYPIAAPNCVDLHIEATVVAPEGGPSKRTIDSWLPAAEIHFGLVSVVRTGGAS